MLRMLKMKVETRTRHATSKLCRLLSAFSQITFIFSYYQLIDCIVLKLVPQLLEEASVALCHCGLNRQHLPMAAILLHFPSHRQY